jgi:hypothetical protein
VGKGDEEEMLRHYLWSEVYKGKVPVTLFWQEIIVSLIIAALLLALYWALKRAIFFGINDNIKYARMGALILSLSLSLAWVVASLNLMGFWSSVIGVALLSLSFIFTMVFLLVTRNQ